MRVALGFFEVTLASALIYEGHFGAALVSLWHGRVALDLLLGHFGVTLDI